MAKLFGASKPLVSVVLPTFNRAHSLVGAISSVLQQSYDRLELIIVDDASTDDTAGLVASLDDPRIKYICTAENLGAAAARNIGVQQALGEFIAFQDSDDIWLPNKLERQLKLFGQLPQEVGALFGWKIVYGRDEKYHYGSGRVAVAPPPIERLLLEEDQIIRFFLGNRLILQSALLRRDCMDGEVWFDPRAKANNDWEFAARLVQRTRIYEDPVPVVVAFVSVDSISKNTRKKLLGLIRLVKNNGALYLRYPHIYARHKAAVARSLVILRKYRLARKMYLSALWDSPIAAIAFFCATLCTRWKRA